MDKWSILNILGYVFIIVACLCATLAIVGAVVVVVGFFLNKRDQRAQPPLEDEYEGLHASLLNHVMMLLVQSGTLCHLCYERQPVPGLDEFGGRTCQECRNELEAMRSHY